EPQPDTAPEAVAETTPDPAAEPLPVEPEEAAAPQETGDVLKTEENKDQEKGASAAPSASPRPAAQPVQPKPAPAEADAAAATEPAQTAAETAPEAPAEDAVADALAEALSGEASEEPAAGTGTAPSGPPLTGGEKDALVVAVKACWNVGALSTDALNTIVTVGVSMDPGGTAPEGPAEEAVADALAEALSGEASEEPAAGTGTAPSGPPLTGGEKDALVVAVKACWNVGALSTDALNTIVTVGVSMDPGGMPN